MAKAVKGTRLSGLPQAISGRPTRQGGKQSLTVFRCNLRFSSKISALGSMLGCFVALILDRSLGI
jgi:hypothetical protein